MSRAAAEGSGFGEAGRKEEDVRSDLHVEVQLTDEGGLQIEVASKVGALYGASIRDTASDVLSKLAVANARVRVDDRGAVPLVIAARVEAAARRAGVTGGDARPARTVVPDPSRDRHRLRRSRLYLPGDQPKFALNAGIHHPDAVILDLEDSVHATAKEAARLLVRNALRGIDFLGAERMVRINQLPLGHDDLEAIVPEAPDVVLLPKTESAAQVREVAAHIRDVVERGDADPGCEVWLMPILETALGIENAAEIARASPEVVALTIGLEDYTADIGVPKTREGAESLYARMRLVNAARAAAVQAIDSVFGDVADEDGLRDWAGRSRALGFEGMGCIHPRQIRPIHEAFAPTAEEIEKALRIVAAFEEAEAKGLAVVSLGTRMVDPPVVLRAQRVVDVARRCGLIEEA